MSYQVLARKWRPRDFATTVGQDHVVRALTHALREQRLHHAYLFTGTRGVGKTTLSRILAKSLNCVGPDGTGGITDQPCGVCEACTAIDAGRFVDYIEMDAASNRGVDEMVALLERAMYAPTNARFKVYMIDEVHQLSNHAFNAMLKTLEEPPDYVKFILATTDPQKVPVTVLSRCLQFNLKNMTPSGIAAHMAEILGHEGIEAEPAALRMLAHGARGSMRDGLSLLDQAIAFAAGPVSLEAVRSMLGAIDSDTLVRLLDALAARDATAMMAIADEMGTRSLSYGQALRDLASLLHRIALTQQVPGAITEEEADAAEVKRLAAAFAPEEVQLYYQIALHGRNDLHLAPDEYAGFTMSLMRMLAFVPDAAPAVRSHDAPLLATRPARTSVAPRAPAPVAALVPAPRPAPVVGKARSDEPPGMPPPWDDDDPIGRARAPVGRPPWESAEPQAPAAAAPRRGPPMPTGRPAWEVDHSENPAPAAPESASQRAAATVARPAKGPIATADWPALVNRLKVVGMARELAARAELIGVEGDTFRLRVALKPLGEAGNVKRLEAALSVALGRTAKVAVEVGVTAGPTAAGIAAETRAELQREAEAAIYADPFVRELIDQFGAEVDASSIRPRSNP
ncbi:MAG: DNA polymerase III subunit gamma/tau [Burkholderiaceae bacterium]